MSCRGAPATPPMQGSSALTMMTTRRQRGSSPTSTVTGAKSSIRPDRPTSHTQGISRSSSHPTLEAQTMSEPTPRWPPLSFATSHRPSEPSAAAPIGGAVTTSHSERVRAWRRRPSSARPKTTSWKNHPRRSRKSRPSTKIPRLRGETSHPCSSRRSTPTTCSSSKSSSTTSTKTTRCSTTATRT